MKRGKIQNTLRQIDDGTLHWSDLHVPDAFIRHYEKARLSGFEKQLESHEYLAFNAVANSQTGNLGQDLRSALASHSTDQHLPEKGKIENTLRQIHDGSLSWNQIIIRDRDSHDHGKTDIRHVPRRLRPQL